VRDITGWSQLPRDYPPPLGTTRNWTTPYRCSSTSPLLIPVSSSDPFDSPERDCLSKQIPSGHSQPRSIGLFIRGFSCQRNRPYLRSAVSPPRLSRPLPRRYPLSRRINLFLLSSAEPEVTHLALASILPAAFASYLLTDSTSRHNLTEMKVRIPHCADKHLYRGACCTDICVLIVSSYPRSRRRREFTQLRYGRLSHCGWMRPVYDKGCSRRPETVQEH
jgi:hypothetical protein